MKRSGPPKRKTPLRRGKPLQRGRLRPTQKRSSLPRRRREGPTELERRKVRVRSGGSCEARTHACTYRAEQMHHVVTRKRGVGWPGLHLADNLLDVCSACHGYIHGHPAESAERGWLKSAPLENP